jgi:hypothetical protein
LLAVDDAIGVCVAVVVHEPVTTRAPVGPSTSPLEQRLVSLPLSSAWAKGIADAGCTQHDVVTRVGIPFQHRVSALAIVSAQRAVLLCHSQGVEMRLVSSLASPALFMNSNPVWAISLVPSTLRRPLGAVGGARTACLVNSCLLVQEADTGDLFVFDGAHIPRY